MRGMKAMVFSMGAAVALLVLAGCQAKASPVVGKWRGKSVSGLESMPADMKGEMEAAVKKMEIEFKADGTVAMEGMPTNEGTPKYTVSGNTVTVIPTGEKPATGPQDVKFTLSADGKTLTQSQMGVEMVFEKVQ